MPAEDFHQRLFREPQDALTDFPERPLALAIIGEKGGERVWLSDELTTPAQLEWAAKHLEAAANIARKMQPGAGRA